MSKPKSIVYDLPHFTALLREKNRYQRALKRIAKGYLLHNGTRCYYTPTFCRSVAFRALGYHLKH